MSGSDETTNASDHDTDQQVRPSQHQGHEDANLEATDHLTSSTPSAQSSNVNEAPASPIINQLTSLNSIDSDDASARQLLGSGTTRLSDFVNDNLIAVRFGASASIVLLAAYGIAHTPLFFRYRTVAELPTKYFMQRKKLPCRIIKSEKDTSSQSLIMYLRHLSPLERLCVSKPWFEWLVSIQPSSIVRKSADQEMSQLLKITLAGAQRPPYDWDDGWFEQLIGNKTPVTCQFLARAVPLSEKSGAGSNSWAGNATIIRSGPNERKKRPIPDMEPPKSLDITTQNQLAICRVYFRPWDTSRGKLLRLFESQDLGLAMVRSGRAVRNDDESLYGISSHDYALVETSDSIKNLQEDAAYFDQLCRAEYEAAHGFRGIWSDASYRANRADVVEEADAYMTANYIQRIWRWIRPGRV